MTMTRLGSLTAALACAMLVAAAAPGTIAVEAADNDGVIRGTVTSANGPEGGRLGDRRDRRPRDRVPQDRRHRRRRAVRAAGAAGRYLRRVGPRLRASRLRAGRRAARPGARPDRGGGGDAPGSGAGLPLHLLAVAHQPARRARVPGHGARGQRHQPADGQPGRVDQQPEGLPALPPGGQQAHPRDPRPRRLRLGPLRLGGPRAARAARLADEQLHHALRYRRRPRHAGRLDRPHRRRRGAAGPTPPAGHRA